MKQGRPQQLRAVERSNHILGKALELLVSQGTHAVTHRQVAALARVPVGSIGYYFGSRENLLIECVNAFADRRAIAAATIIENASVLAKASPNELARKLLGIVVPEPAVQLIGCKGMELDCLRESELLSLALLKLRQETRRDVESTLKAAGRNHDPRSVLVAISGVVLETAHKGDDAAYTAAVRVVAELLAVPAKSNR